jgi:hypothetical protein
VDATDRRQDLSDRVAESVRRALALVGPAESGFEPSSSDSEDDAD